MRFVTRSLLILLVLYGLVLYGLAFAIGDAWLSHQHAPLWLAGVFAVGFADLQYVIAPSFIEWLMNIV